MQALPPSLANPPKPSVIEPFFTSAYPVPLDIFVMICLRHADVLDFPSFRLVCRRWTQVLGSETFRRSFIARYFPDSVAKNPPKSLVEVVKLQMEQLRIARHITRNYFIHRECPTGIAACIVGDQTLAWKDDNNGLRDYTSGGFVDDTYTALHFAEGCTYGVTPSGDFHIRVGKNIVHNIPEASSGSVHHIRGCGDKIYYASGDNGFVRCYDKVKGPFPTTFGRGITKVTCLEATPEHLYIGYAEGHVEIVDCQSLQIARCLQHQEDRRECNRLTGITCMQYSHGKLYVGGANGDVSIWDLTEKDPRHWKEIGRIHLRQPPVYALCVHDCWLFIGYLAPNLRDKDSSLLCYNIFTQQHYQMYDTRLYDPETKNKKLGNLQASVSFVRYQEGRLVTVFDRNTCHIFDFTPSKERIFGELVTLKNASELTAHFFSIIDEQKIKEYQKNPKPLKGKSDKEGCAIA